MQHHKILRICTKLLLGPILLFALYVQFHGDFGPGGGFQAGVIFSAGFILYGLIFGVSKVQKVISIDLVRQLAVLGVLIYGGTGVLCMILGAEFLNYNVLDDTATQGQHWGILLVELGVGVTVAAVMLMLFYAFADNKNKFE